MQRKHNKDIVRTDLAATYKTIETAVGEGLAPPEITVKLKPCGEVVKEQLQLIETRFPSVTVEDYVIMPDHIHAVIFLHEKTGGASPSPTLDDILCAFKSLTSRNCKQKYGIEKMLQRSSAGYIFDKIYIEGGMLMVRLTLDKYLDKCGITRYELAKRTGVKFQTLDRYYKNDVVRYDSDILDRICTALGCSLYDIIEYVKDK